MARKPTGTGTSQPQRRSPRKTPAPPTVEAEPPPDVRTELSAALLPVIPEDDKRKLVVETAVQVVSHVNHVSIYAGNYPAPSIVREFEEAVPGFHERASANSARAMEIEHRERMFSMILGLVGTLASLALAGFCVAHGERWVAGLVISTSALGVLRLFLGRSTGKEQR